MSTQHKTAAIGANNGFSVGIRPAHLLALGHLSDSDIDLIAWTHQEISNSGWSWPVAAREIGMSRKTIIDVIKGVYPAADWRTPLTKFREFQQSRIAAVSGENFCENIQSQRIFQTLSHVYSERGLGMIIGESRAGKTTAAKEWIQRGNLGRGIYVECSVNGGVGGLLHSIGSQLGIKVPKTGIVASMDRICASLSERNFLILDEAGNLIPHKGSGTSRPLETVRQIASRVGCGVCFLVTERDTVKLSESNYQFEQLIGRFVLPPVRLPEFEREDIEPIIRQFGEFGDSTYSELLDVSKSPGRLDRMIQILKDTRRVATFRKHSVPGDRDFREAMDQRRLAASGARSIADLNRKKK